jgi:NADH-quinone oxidoreductase subunit N
LKLCSYSIIFFFKILSTCKEGGQTKTSKMSIVLLLFGSCLKLVFGGVYKNFSYNKENLKSFFLISVVILFFTLLLEKESGLFSSYFTLTPSFSCSFFLSLINTIILMGALLTLIISYKTLKNFFSFFPEFFAIFNLYLVGALLLVSSQDIITAYISIEIQSLCLYLLAAFNKDSVFSSEAGIKYFILGALASCFIAFGFSFIYMTSGSIFLGDFFSFSLYSLLKTFPWYGACLGMSFIITGFLFKLALAPFHFWVADIYEGAPFNSSIFFASFSKTPFFFFLSKMLYSYLSLFVGLWSFPLSLSAFLSVLLGTFGALYQTKLKRFLAYSGVVNSGLIFFGLSSGTLEGLFSGCLCFLIYIFSSFSVWSFMGSLGKLTTGGASEPVFITELSSLFRLNRPLGSSLIIMMFSLGGVPPLSGFFSKFYVFLSLVDSGLYSLSFCGILIVCLSTFYYLRVIKVILVETPPKWLSFSTFRFEVAFISYGILFFMLTFFFLSPLLLKIAYFIAISIVF